MRKILAVAALAAVTALGLSACAAQPSYAQVCEQRTTHERLADAQCATTAHNTAAIWVYLLATHRVPAVGEHIVSATTRTLPENAEIGHAPATGGHVTVDEQAPAEHAPAENAPIEHAPVEEPHISIRG